MRTRTRCIGLGIALCLCLAWGATGALAEDAWTLNKALKQIDKATKDIKGMTGKVAVTDVRAGEAAVEVEGKAAIVKSGSMRIEVSGETSMTILVTPDVTYVFDPVKLTYRESKNAKDPVPLEQFGLLGFSTAGSELKKDFLLALLDAQALDGHNVVVLELTPKAEDLRKEVAKIQIWVDQANWLPIQQKIYHSAADTYLMLRYSELGRDDKIDNAQFKPKWPKGTKKEK